MYVRYKKYRQSVLCVFCSRFQKQKRGRGEGEMLTRKKQRGEQAFGGAGGGVREREKDLQATKRDNVLRFFDRVVEKKKGNNKIVGEKKNKSKSCFDSKRDSPISVGLLSCCFCLEIVCSFSMIHNLRYLYVYKLFVIRLSR